MVLELSKSITHNCSNQAKGRYSEEELKALLLQLMQRSGIRQDQISFTEDGVLQVDESSNLKLHNLVLQAEKLGLQMKFTKKTLIEIC